VVEQTTAGDRLDPPFDVFLRRYGSERCTTVRSEEKPASSTIEELHTKNIFVNRTDSIMFATRRVTAEIFSIVGSIRHESTSATLESSLWKAYGERQRR
jgi:hypothetical protein